MTTRRAFVAGLGAAGLAASGLELFAAPAGGRALGALLRHSVVVGDERLVSFVPAFGFAVGKRNPASSRAWRFGARGRDQQLWLKGAPSTWRQAGYGNRFERLRTQKRTLKCD